MINVAKQIMHGLLRVWKSPVRFVYGYHYLSAENLLYDWEIVYLLSVLHEKYTYAMQEIFTIYWYF